MPAKVAGKVAPAPKRKVTKASKSPKPAAKAVDQQPPGDMGQEVSKGIQKIAARPKSKDIAAARKDLNDLE